MFDKLCIKGRNQSLFITENMLHVRQMLVILCLCTAVTAAQAVFEIDTESLIKEHCRFYCDSSPILDAVQKAEIFKDSKHFVDMPLKTSEAEALEAFDNLKKNAGDGEIDKDALVQFVNEHFDPPGSELEPCLFKDWMPRIPRLPAFDGVPDPVLKAWAYDLSGKWKTLCRKVKQKSDDQTFLSTFVNIPHPFVIPGGRFREIYYWDTYWIIRGLLQSDMEDLAKGMILNFASFVTRFGFVPNGARAYYLRRSQPPLLIPMAYEYWEATHDDDFLREILPTLDAEHAFWQANRRISITGKDGVSYQAFHYSVDQKFPRPESYREDVATAEGFNDDEKERVYMDIASAAESGWDFSSRWFDPQTPKDLTSIKTTKKLPVDLNAFLAWNQRLLAIMHRFVGNIDQYAAYNEMREATEEALNGLFWNPSVGIWQDVDVDTKEHTSAFYASNLVPLYTGHASVDQVLSSVDYLKNLGIGSELYPGGIPTSLNVTGQQWDAPNGWPPSNHMIIMGLANSNIPEAERFAQKLARHWIRTNYLSYRRIGKMVEKFDVEERDPGEGGEYDVQEGFGWTNGVIIDLIVRFQHSVGIRKWWRR